MVHILRGAQDTTDRLLRTLQRSRTSRGPLPHRRRGPRSRCPDAQFVGDYSTQAIADRFTLHARKASSGATPFASIAASDRISSLGRYSSVSGARASSCANCSPWSSTCRIASCSARSGSPAAMASKIAACSLIIVSEEAMRLVARTYRRTTLLSRSYSPSSRALPDIRTT